MWMSLKVIELIVWRRKGEQGGRRRAANADLQPKEGKVACRRPDQQAGEDELHRERDYQQPYRHSRKDNEARRRYHRCGWRSDISTG